MKNKNAFTIWRFKRFFHKINSLGAKNKWKLIAYTFLKILTDKRAQNITIKFLQLQKLKENKSVLKWR